MKFTSTPAGFSSFRRPLVYAFDAEGEARDLTFTIVDTESGAVIGTKRLYAATAGEIDIAPYVRRAVHCRLPESVAECWIIDTGGRMKVRVDAEGVSSPTRSFIAADVALDVFYTPLTTQYLHRTMAAGEVDMIGYFAAPDAVVRILVEAFGSAYAYLTLTPPDGGQRTVAVTTEGFGIVPESMKVTIKVDDEPVTVIEYRITENLPHARRLAWLNRHGAPELYTFPTCGEAMLRALHRDTLTYNGRGTVVDDCDRTLRLVSAYEPQAQSLALAEIVCSPEVRMACGTELRRVVVADDEAARVVCEGMNLMEVAVRAAEREVEL